MFNIAALDDFSVILSDAMQDQKFSILLQIILQYSSPAGPKITFKGLDNFSVILSDAMQDQKLSIIENIATLRAGPKITFRALNNFSVILSDAMQ